MKLHGVSEGLPTSNMIHEVNQVCKTVAEPVTKNEESSVDSLSSSAFIMVRPQNPKVFVRIGENTAEINAAASLVTTANQNMLQIVRGV